MAEAANAFSAVALADSALFQPARRSVGDRESGDHVIYAGDASLDLSGDLFAPGLVAREDAGVQPVSRIVRQAQRLLFVPHAHNRQHGAESLFGHDLHRVVDLRENSRLEVAPREVRVAAAPGEDLRAARLRVVDVVFDYFDLLRESHRADVDARLDFAHVGALAQRAGLIDDAASELIGDGVFDVNAFDRDADLARIGERAPDRRVGRALDVGVAQNDHRVFAAEFEAHRDQSLRRALGDRLAGARAAGERDHIGLVNQRAPRLAVAVDDLQNVCRRAGGGEGFAKDVRAAHGDQRGPLRRFDHDGVARSQRRNRFADGQDQREIPRRDHADDATQLVMHSDLFVAQQVRCHAMGSQKAARPFRIKRQRVANVSDLDQRFDPGLTVLPADQFDQLFAVSDQTVAGREQNLRATLEINRAPHAKGLARALRGCAHVERRIDLDLAYFFERRGAANFDFLSCFYTETLRHDRPPGFLSIFRESEQ